MPVCCRCNGSGRCVSCFCIKSGRCCVDCLPSRKGHCSNKSPAAAPTSMPAADNGHFPSVDMSATENSDNAVDSQDVLAMSAPEGINASAMLDDVISDDVNMRTNTASIDFPSFKPAPTITSSWGDLSGEELTKAIDDAYAQVVHWRPNLFKVPSGACGKQIVSELTRLFNAFALESDLEAIALKAAMTLP